jgi:hypothetical protein
MLGLTQLRFAAAALAIAAVAMAGSSARAFTFQTLDGSSTGGSRFADPDDADKNSDRGARGPAVQFNTGPGPMLGPTGRMNPMGFSSGPRPPDPYGPRSLGNND